MQLPGFMLYSEKSASKGWYLDETCEDLKKRLPKKFHYEVFIDNNIWSGIMVILELLHEDKNSDFFSQKFNNGKVNTKHVFELYSTKFALKIELQPFGLAYQLGLKNMGSVSYKVNFEKEVIGKDLERDKLIKYEALFKKVCGLIKKDRNDLKTRFH